MTSLSIYPRKETVNLFTRGKMGDPSTGSSQKSVQNMGTRRILQLLIYHQAKIKPLDVEWTWFAVCRIYRVIFASRILSEWRIVVDGVRLLLQKILVPTTSSRPVRGIDSKWRSSAAK
ncbi:hypothetical protein L798_03584 [Zootermopsis nevadensis]|uniref:Uncharacterized protein n=1 Tax=Zootermopsis nevadensis TaxID=136037 RepID=A0A067QFB2_ZOONE|nr:hypothetical protein L798_03584 [Zootermopsis nevadensis]